MEEVARIVAQLRAQWPAVRIIVRADSGFARDALMAWCEAHGVDYVLGLARNERLEAAITARAGAGRDRLRGRRGRRCALYKDFRLPDADELDAGAAGRRQGGAPAGQGESALRRDVARGRARGRPPPLYEQLYCARGDMENRIKEQQLGLFADRTSTATMRANQLRLWLASVAYVLVHELRRVGLRGTALARAQVTTIRTRLLKLGGLVRVSVRRIAVALSGVFPLRAPLRPGAPQSPDRLPVALLTAPGALRVVQRNPSDKAAGTPRCACRGRFAPRKPPRSRPVDCPHRMPAVAAWSTGLDAPNPAAAVAAVRNAG